MSHWFSSKILHITAYCIVATAAVFILVVIWMIFYPTGGGSVINSITVPDVVRAGEEVHIVVDYCKTVEGKAESNYTLITESQAFYAPPLTTSRPVGCDTATVPIIIPPTAMSGEAHYELDVFRQFNPLNTGVESAKSNTFMIINDNQ